MHFVIAPTLWRARQYGDILGVVRRRCMSGFVAPYTLQGWIGAIFFAVDYHDLPARVARQLQVIRQSNRLVLIDTEFDQPCRPPLERP